MTHGSWAIVLLVIGLLVMVMATKISTWKTQAWARFYARHPDAAQQNPLSKHAGSERSIRLGAAMWRLIGGLILLNGVIQLLISMGHGTKR
jgi:hypothetical protein